MYLEIHYSTDHSMPELGTVAKIISERVGVFPFIKTKGVKTTIFGKLPTRLFNLKNIRECPNMKNFLDNSDHLEPFLTPFLHASTLYIKY